MNLFPAMLSFSAHEEEMTMMMMMMSTVDASARTKPPHLSCALETRRTTANSRSKSSRWSHFSVYISGALRSRKPATAAARIPAAGTARAQEAAYVLQRGVRGRAGCAGARARGRVSWKHRPGVFTQARSRASPVVQSARTWGMEGDVEPALNVGQGWDC